jgi:hypothetical protein
MSEAKPAPALFGVLWDAMADVMGSATTATLMRRAAKRGLARHPAHLDLGRLVIARDGLEYRYELPPSWQDDRLRQEAVCTLLRELQPMLIELTSDVVMRRLAEIPELSVCGPLPFPEEP